MEHTEQPNEFEAVKARLEEIAGLVDDEAIPLDDALDLYEEAVKLGLQASNLLEVGIAAEDGSAAEGESEGLAEAPSGSPSGKSADDPAATSGSAQLAGPSGTGSDAPVAG